MAISLVKVFSGGSTTYVEDHESNYTTLEENINTLLNVLGSANGGPLAVPAGLQEIFDRNGVIGKGSYRFAEGSIGGFLLTVPPGAAWLGNVFRKNSASQTVDLTGLPDGVLYLDVSTGGIASAETASGASTLYNFTWASGTTTISSRTLLTGILFDGTDYNDVLSSTALATNYESLAERLEDAEARLGTLGSFYMQDLGTTTGLTFGYKAGRVRNNNVVTDTASGTIALPPSTTNNYIQVNPSTGVVSANTTGFTSNFVPLFRITSAASTLSVIDDKRTWAALGGGGGGGHAQNTDTGTDGIRFDLVLGQSTGSTNAAFGVDRGSDPTVEVRWNETSNVWEFTNDGSVYSPIGNLDLGVQELSKLVMLEEPLLATEVLNISTAASYTLVDLTSASELLPAAVFGVSGIIYRVQYWDDAASLTTNVKFRKPINPATSPAVAFNVQAKLTGDHDEQALTELIIEGEGVDASDTLHQGFEYLATTSGAGTGHLRVYMTGFFAKVSGVGTQDKDLIFASHTVSPSTETDFNLTSFINRGLVHKFKVEETSGNPVAGYNVKLYSRDTFASSTLLYQVDSIDPATAYEDYLPLWVEDLDLTSELHLRINNTDGSNTGVYTVTIDVEQFA